MLKASYHLKTDEKIKNKIEENDEKKEEKVKKKEEKIRK